MSMGKRKQMNKEKQVSVEEINKENIRNIQKSKRSYYVTLPASYVRKLGWNRAGKMVIVYRVGSGLFIEEFGGRNLNFAPGFKK
jgi:hypothetical protein